MWLADVLLFVCGAHRAPKGIKYTCELTGEPATVQTEINGVTYFYACVRRSSAASWPST